MEIQNMKLSERLIELRKEKKLSQAELAEALDVSRQSVSLWENGGTVPTLDKLRFLAEFYGITVDELVGAVEEKPKPQEQAAPPQKTAPEQKRKVIWRRAAVLAVILLLAAIVIAVIVRKEKVKEPISIGDIQGVVIAPDEIPKFEFDQD